MSLSLSSPVASQATVVAIGAALLALTPPADGNLLLVPLAPGPAARMLPLALARGARLVARGPLPASMVVRGRRDTLWGVLARAGVLVVAAPAAACGERNPSR